MKIILEIAGHAGDGVHAMQREVDWPAVPRADEWVEPVEDYSSYPVMSVGYQCDGVPLVRLRGHVGRDSVDAFRSGGWT